MEVKGFKYSAGDFIPFGSVLKSSLSNARCVGVDSEETECEGFGFGKREVFHIWFNLTTNPTIQAEPYYSDPMHAPSHFGRRARTGRRIHVIGFCVSIYVTYDDVVGTGMTEAPAGNFSGTDTHEPPDYLRVMLIVEHDAEAGFHTTEGCLLDPSNPEVSMQFDNTGDGGYSCIFNRQIPITPGMSFTETHYIDCDYVAVFPDDGTNRPVVNRFVCMHWANTRSYTARREHNIRVTQYYLQE